MKKYYRFTTDLAWDVDDNNIDNELTIAYQNDDSDPFGPKKNHTFVNEIRTIFLKIFTSIWSMPVLSLCLYFLYAECFNKGLALVLWWLFGIPFLLILLVIVIIFKAKKKTKIAKNIALVFNLGCLIPICLMIISIIYYSFIYSNSNYFILEENNEMFSTDKYYAVKDENLIKVPTFVANKIERTCTNIYNRDTNNYDKIVYIGKNYATEDGILYKVEDGVLKNISEINENALIEIDKIYVKSENHLNTTVSKPLEIDKNDNNLNTTIHNPYESIIELRYKTSVVGDSAVFPAAFVPDKDAYSEINMAEIYANNQQQEGHEELIRNVCKAMYRIIQYNEAKICITKDNKEVYVKGYKWENDKDFKMHMWKYTDGTLKRLSKHEYIKM